jgi:hypothetical protein
MNPTVQCPKACLKRGASLRPDVMGQHETKRYNRTARRFLRPVAQGISFATFFLTSKNKVLEVAKVSCKKLPVSKNRADL